MATLIRKEKNQRYAVIDIGSLKVKTLIGSFDASGKLQKRYASNTNTCFGCDLDANNGYVSEDNFVKTLAELKRVKQVLKKYNVQQFKVVSTHAMRRAKNRNELIDRIDNELGFRVDNISQRQEAELFFQAVMRTFSAKKQEYALVDVGGGSVQVLIGNATKLERVHMMHTGSELLLSRFVPGSNSPANVTRQIDLDRIREHIIEQLIPYRSQTKLPLIYGSSNIIDLMQAIGIPLEEHEDSVEHPYKTYAKHLEVFIKKVLPLSYEQREKQFAFQKGYMWAIDIAFLNILTLAKHFHSPYIIPTNANIAQGIIYDLAGR